MPNTKLNPYLFLCDSFRKKYFYQKISGFDLYIYLPLDRASHPSCTLNLANLECSLTFIRKLVMSVREKPLASGVMKSQFPLFPLSHSRHILRRNHPVFPFSFQACFSLTFFPLHTLPAWEVHRVGFLHVYTNLI